MSKEETGRSLKLILDILKDTSPDNRIAKSEICRKLAANDITLHRHTIDNKLSILRDMGYNIVEIPRKGVYLEQEESDLSEGQLRILIDSIISANLLNKKNLKLTVESLAKLGSKDFAKHMKRYAVATSEIANNANQSIAYNVEEIQQAILEKKQISCNYIVYDQTFTPQRKYVDAIILNPYEMAFSDGKYYLVCSFDNSEDITVLRVDRLTDVKVMDSKCQENQEIEKLKKGKGLHNYIYTQPQLRGGKLEIFTLLCYRESLDEVHDAFGDNMRIRNDYEENYDDPDTVRVTVETTREAMKAWAIIHAENAVVIKPEDLKDEIMEVIESAKFTYEITGQPAWVRSRRARSLEEALRELKISKRKALIYRGQADHRSYEKIDLSKYDFSFVDSIRFMNCDISGSNFSQDLNDIESISITRTKFDHEFLYQLPNIENLELWELDINDLSFIKEHPSIEKIHICRCDNITDFTPLLELPNLKEISIHNEAFDDNIRSLIQSRFPEISIYDERNRIRKDIKQMANRPAYSINNGRIIRKDYDFQWFAGFAPSQKQKSINSLHEAVTKADSNARPLEISTKSTVELGQKLSAFNLKYNGYTLENIFQSSKVFTNGGPYRDLLDVPPKDAKKDERLRNSGKIVRFNYNNYDFPLEPKSLFYDYIYINAVKESLTSEEIQQIKDYTCFTDIEFNPQKSINTQAKTVAIIKLMLDMYGEIPELGIDDFIVFHKQYVKA